MELHDNLVLLGKVLVVALAVGLDVLAVAVGIGVTRPALRAGLRLGVICATAEIVMQLIGYELGARAGQMLGVIATYAGFALLALVGLLMLRNALRAAREASFDVTSGGGLLMIALSISLDSLAVGVALPAAGIPLLPLLITVSITTTAFTLIGLAFGARLGQRYEHGAEGLAGAILILLAAFFILERLIE
ncbi:MAG: manganese efflux pump MntP family protein [Candidatus Binataceae bacterium]